MGILYLLIIAINRKLAVH